MVQITVKVDGMQCSMCESHVNEAVRRALPVKKATSYHGKGRTVLLAAQPLAAKAMRAAIEPTGYRVLGIESGPCRKKGFFGLFG